MTTEFGWRKQRDPQNFLLDGLVMGLRVSRIDNMVCNEEGQWRSSGNKSSITFTLERTDFIDDSAVLIFDVQVPSLGTRGMLRVDYGSGFRDASTVTLDYGHPRTSALILTQLHGIRALRWVPSRRATDGIGIFGIALVETDAATREVVQTIPRFGGPAGSRVLDRAMALAGFGKPRQAAAAFVQANAVLHHTQEVREERRAPAAAPSDQAEDRTLVAVFREGADTPLADLLQGIDQTSSPILILDGTEAPPPARLPIPQGVEVVRLGGCTPAKAYNIALAEARRRGCRFVVLAKGDVRRTAGVLPSLLAEMSADSGLGIIAPSEVVDEDGGPVLVRRAVWDLAAVTFGHDTGQPLPHILRLEADFCEMSYALVRVAAAEAVGGFDEGFRSCREDADFAFRLRVGGYGCASLNGVSVARKARRPVEPELAHRDTQRFVGKHLGFGVRPVESPLGALPCPPWSNGSLIAQFRRHGLVSDNRPTFRVGQPGEAPFDYLYTTCERSRLPPHWTREIARYRTMFDPSTRSAALFRQAGFEDVHHLPLGIDTDVFHSCGDSARRFDEPTFLWVGQGGGLGDLEDVLRAWRRFRASATNAKLVLVGSVLLSRFGQYRSDVTSLDGSLGLDLPYEGLYLREVARDPTASERAELYRSVDGLISARARDGFDPTVNEAMACGLIAIVPDSPEDGGDRLEGALTVDGDWPLDQVGVRLRQAGSLSDQERARIGAASARLIRSRQTWHQTCFALRAALASSQEQDDLLYGPPDPSPTLSNLDLALALEKSRSGRWPNKPAASEPDHPLDDFDPNLYLALNPDVAAAQLNGTEHFMEHGWRESRSVSPYFTSAQYLAANRKARQFLLRSSGIDPEVASPDAQARPTAAPFHDAARTETDALPRAGTQFIGYVEAGLGLAESLRNLISAVESADLDFKIYPFNVGVENRFIGRFREDLYDFDHAYAVNVFEMAADQLPCALRELRDWRTKNSYNILRTYWELSKADESWRTHLSTIHELWAPTTFVANAFEQIFSKKIFVVPTIVSVKLPQKVDRSLFKLRDDIFYFVFSFDYYSRPARKNPVAVIRAFVDAFPGVDAVGLVIKTVGPKSLHPRTRAEIETLASSDPRIVIIDESLTREGMTALLAACDCYVSLHRSEGFGLGMAEAMLLGKPVIGTFYGGCTDFLSESTAFPVRFTLRRLRHGEYPFSDHLEWAEPDHDHAVACLRTVFGNHAEAAARAAEGQRFIRANFGAESVGALAAGRLREIVAQRSRGAGLEGPEHTDNEPKA